MDRVKCEYARGGDELNASTTELTPGQRRIEKAQTKRLRDADEKLAIKLRRRGWTCIPPEDTASHQS